MLPKPGDIEEKLPAYFSGELSDSDRFLVDEWRKESVENESFFRSTQKAWEAIGLLNEMEQFDSLQALKKVNKKISQSGHLKLLSVIQLIAAILLLPLSVLSGYLIIRNISLAKNHEKFVVMQTVTSRQGMITMFSLADGTMVWLNSGSVLQFPSLFSGDKREVRLSGEAFFEVKKNPEQPFRVSAGDLKIDVSGTSFNVVNYNEEQQIEVILCDGEVSVSSGEGNSKKDYGSVKPGQRGVFSKSSNEFLTEEVRVDKYISWREGVLQFRDDPMQDVIRRLSRWFNVDFIVNDPEILGYIYTATFENENLDQLLKLLKLSAPIDYRIIESKVLPDNGFTKKQIYLMKKK
jgi:ferric-dicitrate binding protein FerR (iron transport regulator)